MRRKIKHTKRYKDYPKNVPKKLLREFFHQHNLSVSRLAFFHDVNTGVISKLINDGIEPQDNVIRERIHLKPIDVCPSCGRKIIKRKPAAKKDQPEHMKAWKHLSAEERNKVIEQYIRYKSSKLTIH